MSVSQSIYLSLTMFLFLFLVGNTQFYKRLCPFVGLSVGPVVRQHESKSWKISVLEVGKGVGCWVWMGVGCPCPPVRNDIVIPRHLLSIHRDPKLLHLRNGHGLHLAILLGHRQNFNLDPPSPRSVLKPLKRTLFLPLSTRTTSTKRHSLKAISASPSSPSPAP